jgi:hypothetical protein
VARAGEGAAGVDPHDQIEPLHLGLHHRSPVERPRVVHQEIDLPEPLERLRGRPLDRGVVPHVERDRQPPPPERLDLAHRLVNRPRQLRVGRHGLGRHHHVAPLCRQPQRQDLPDAPRGSGDERDPILEVH